MRGEKAGTPSSYLFFFCSPLNGIPSDFTFSKNRHSTFINMPHAHSFILHEWSNFLFEFSCQRIPFMSRTSYICHYIILKMIAAKRASMKNLANHLKIKYLFIQYKILDEWRPFSFSLAISSRNI